MDVACLTLKMTAFIFVWKNCWLFSPDSSVLLPCLSLLCVYVCLFVSMFVFSVSLCLSFLCVYVCLFCVSMSFLCVYVCLRRSNVSWSSYVCEIALPAAGSGGHLTCRWTTARGRLFGWWTQTAGERRAPRTARCWLCDVTTGLINEQCKR